jgi:hypothetical protein
MQGRIIGYKVTGGDPKGYRTVLMAQTGGAADDESDCFRQAAHFSR